MNEPTLDILTQRLDRLERENRRLKRWGALMLLSMSAVLTMGQIPARTRTIEAEEFVLKDGTGKDRAVLATVEDGTPFLGFIDKDRRLRVSFGLESTGAPLLSLIDKNNKVRLVLAVKPDVPDDLPVLILFNKDQEQRALLTIKPDGVPFVVLLNKDGKAIWKAP